MPRVPVHSVEDAPSQSQQPLEQLRATFGKVLNIYGEMAHSPATIGAYTGMQQGLAAHGTFDARTREAIALAVGAVDDCGYCQSAHTGGAQAAGWSSDETVSLRNGEHVGEEKLEALLALARQIARQVGEVDDAAWQRAVDAGWSKSELTELFAHVAVNLFTNYFNHYVGTELDIPAAPGIAAGH